MNQDLMEEVRTHAREFFQSEYAFKMEYAKANRAADATRKPDRGRDIAIPGI